MRIFFIRLHILISLIVSFFPRPSWAASLSEEVTETLKKLSVKWYGKETTPGPTEIATVVGNFFQWFFAVAGIAFLILMVYAGNKWMGAAGNDEAVEAAKKTLVRAIIGFIVMMTAFAMMQAVGLLIEQSGLAG